MEYFFEIIVGAMGAIFSAAVVGFFMRDLKQSERILLLESKFEMLLKEQAENNVVLETIRDRIATKDDLGDLELRIEKELMRLRTEFDLRLKLAEGAAKRV